MATATQARSVLARADVYYGLVGCFLLAQFGSEGAWLSFLLGWILAEANFEVIRRLVSFIIALFRDQAELGLAFYGLIAGKFAIWALIFLVVSLVSWLQGVPFALGISALVVAGLGLGLKEIMYARESARI